jgi:heme exporter protein CcmD
MSDLFSMAGHGFYVWMSYGAAAIVVVAEILAVRSRRRAAIADAQAAAPDPQPPAPLSGAAPRR